MNKYANSAGAVFWLFSTIPLFGNDSIVLLAGFVKMVCPASLMPPEGIAQEETTPLAGMALFPALVVLWVFRLSGLLGMAGCFPIRFGCFSLIHFL